MAEEIQLAAPVQVDPGSSRFRIAGLAFNWDTGSIAIRLREWDGTAFGPRHASVGYDGPEAVVLMQQLNKVNLSVKSLHQRVLEKLVADGKWPTGTISGAPE